MPAARRGPFGVGKATTEIPTLFAFPTQNPRTQTEGVLNCTPKSTLYHARGKMNPSRVPISTISRNSSATATDAATALHGIRVPENCKKKGRCSAQTPAEVNTTPTQQDWSVHPHDNKP
jgi:hypothetical protein